MIEFVNTAAGLAEVIAYMGTSEQSAYLGGLDEAYALRALAPLQESGVLRVWAARPILPRGRAEVAGGIAAIQYKSPFRDETVVTVLAWVSEVPLIAAALLRRVEEWADEIGAARAFAALHGASKRDWLTNVGCTPRSTNHLL